MMNLKIEFVNTDQMIRAKMEIAIKDQNDPVVVFFKRIREELAPGETAYIEVAGLADMPLTFEISCCEDWLIRETIGPAEEVSA